MINLFDVKLGKNLFKASMRDYNRSIHVESDERFIRVLKGNHFYNLTSSDSYGNIREEQFLSKNTLIKSIDYTNMSEAILCEDQIKFLMLENSGVLEREHHYIQFFFHKNLKAFVTNKLINLLKEDQIRLASYRFFKNIPKESMIHSIERLTIDSDKKIVKVYFTGVLDGLLNYINIEFEEFNDILFSNIIKRTNELSNKTISEIDVYLQFNFVNNNGKWVLNRTPLVLHCRSNEYNSIYLSSFNVFDFSVLDKDYFLKNREFVVN